MLAKLITVGQEINENENAVAYRKPKNRIAGKTEENVVDGNWQFIQL